MKLKAMFNQLENFIKLAVTYFIYELKTSKMLRGIVMCENLTIRGLQEYIKGFDHQPDKKNDYFLKLIEEVGELADALRKNKRLNQTGNIKGTVEEEMYDILYYISALANIYEVDLEQCFHLKEEINREKYKNKDERA